MNQEDQIIDYLNGELSDSDRIGLERKLQADSTLRVLLEEYKELYGSFARQEMLVPAKQELSFDKNEAASTQRDRVIRMLRYLAAAAAAILLLVLVRPLDLGVGHAPDSSEVVLTGGTIEESSAAQFASLLASTSVTTRISAVQQDVDDENEVIIQLLVQTLQKDQSPNVRLATVETLEKYMHVDLVREIMIRRLSEEQDDFVKIALIQSLSNYNDSDAIQSIERLTQQTDLPKYIKDEAYLGLTKIKTI